MYKKRVAKTTAPATTIRIEEDVKEKANQVFDSLGVSLSAAINMFLKRVIRDQGLPFDLKLEKETKTTGGNLSLNNAFLARKDEFYTRYEDVAEEMQYYTAQFAGKTVLCNCDDPFESAFFRYFILNFNDLGLAALISTAYSGSSLAGQEYPLSCTPRAYKAVVTEVPDIILIRPDDSLDLESVFACEGNHLSELEGDGDFRSEECQEILYQADIVATNPPFSLFREYIGQLQKFEKDFIILGNMNAATTKEIFPLFQDNKIWYGQSIRSGDRKFYVPDDYPLKASGCGIDEQGRRFIRVKGVRWFTNIVNGALHTPLPLIQKFDSEENPLYDNYKAIEVKRTANIPSDYDGIMGVPITFLDKYSPDQFKILMLANGNARTNVDSSVLKKVGYQQHPEDRGGVTILDGRRTYARILIQRKHND